jgi:hypothetical protein
MAGDFFRNRLDQMIDLRHPLAVLANRMPWQEIEASLAQRWARQVKAGKKIEDLDLFPDFDSLRQFRQVGVNEVNDLEAAYVFCCGGTFLQS